MNWYKIAHGPDDEEKEPTLDDIKAAFVQRMQELGLTPEEIERAIKSGYLQRMMTPPEHKRKK